MSFESRLNNAFEEMIMKHHVIKVSSSVSWIAMWIVHRESKNKRLHSRDT